eukprot:jgi/Pico_ML_1/53202/g396.t1
MATLNSNENTGETSDVASADTSTRGSGMVSAWSALLHDALHEAYGPRHMHVREKLLEAFKDPLFQPDYYLSIAAYRELTLQRLKVVADMKLFSVVDYVEDPMKFQIALETLAWQDHHSPVCS